MKNDSLNKIRISKTKITEKNNTIIHLKIIGMEKIKKLFRN